MIGHYQWYTRGRNFRPKTKDFSLRFWPPNLKAEYGRMSNFRIFSKWAVTILSCIYAFKRKRCQKQITRQITYFGSIFVPTESNQNS